MLVSRVCHSLLCLMLLVASLSGAAETVPHTRIALDHGRWLINDRPTNPGSAAEGLLMNVRMVNAVFEDRRNTRISTPRPTRTASSPAFPNTPPKA